MTTATHKLKSFQLKRKQTRCIWAFCTKYGTDGLDYAKWVSSDLEKYHASKIIGYIKDFEKEPSVILMNKITVGIRVYFDGFIFRRPKWSTNNVVVEKFLNEFFDEVEFKNIPSPPVESEDEEEIQPPLPTGYPVREGYIKPAFYDEMVSVTESGQNLLLVGPAGLGKSRLASEIAYSLNLDGVTPIACGGAIRYGQLFGSDKITTDKDGNQVSVWQPAPFLEAIQHPRVVVLDEIFGLSPDVGLGLNPILELDSRQINTPIGVIHVHPKCIIIATSNTNGRSLSNKHTGANVADMSLIDRFILYAMDYDPHVEDELLKKAKCGTRDRLKDNLTSLRTKLLANNIFYDASTRRLIKSIELCNMGINTGRAFELAFLTNLSRAERLKLGV